MLRFLVVPATAILVAAAQAQPPPRPPVIDMHVHSAATSPAAALALMNSLNIRYVFLSSSAADIRPWAAVDPNRYLPALTFPCEGGRSVVVPFACFDTLTDFPELAWLRGELQAGHIRGFGEVVSQYLGMPPTDPRLEPFWQLAEEFDIPVAIHMGLGPPGAAYSSSPAAVQAPNFRMTAGDPLLLEEVLLKHKRLRVFVMHAGWPQLEAMLALLYAHPNVHVDVGALHALIPRTGYYRYLRGLVENGFGKRVMFGSDLRFANQVGPGIEAILAADFLSEEQKTDILCKNAQRFLRLGDAICAP